jgi:hypothetical protein
MLLDQIAFLDDRIAQLSARAARLTATMPEAWSIDADGTTGPDTDAAPDAPALNALARLVEIPRQRGPDGHIRISFASEIAQL